MFDVFALAAAIVVMVITGADVHWNLGYLAIIAALTVGSDMTSVEMGSRRVRVSGSFLGLMLAAVLLGGGAAAIVGVATIIAGRIRWRIESHYFLSNLVIYAWFPLVSGLLFRTVVHHAGLSPHEAGYYLLVFGTFVFALALDISTTAAFICYFDPSPWRMKVREMVVPILAPELAANLLTLFAVYIATQLGIVGLALFAIVLVVFQYLVGELLTSQRRGEELRLRATTDELTGLANRQSFSDRVAAEIETCRDTGEGFGVLLLDLDRFKEINDTLGHQYGDVLLRHVGPRLADRIGPDGLVARLGGDEFAVLSGRRTDRREVLEAVAEDLIACVQEPIVVEDISLAVSSSVGIAVYPEDGDDVQTLMRRADIAMYTAKEHRGGYRLYDPQQDHHSTQRLSVLGDFRRALNADEVVVHYQPIVDLRSQSLNGAEALVRWQHPELGLLYPDKFLQIVEQTELIGPLTDQVLDRSIEQCAAWRRAGLELTIAVNLSVRNLVDPNLATKIEWMLARHGVPASALQLEITESMIMSDPERALATVSDLSALGVRLAVDDFGTGHSSLANLRRLPIDELKIDRSFVTPMLHDENDLIIVRSTINLAHDLGLITVAEGVEDEPTVSRLDRLGCDHVQGYHFSKPVPAGTFTAWAEAFQRLRTPA